MQFPELFLASCQEIGSDDVTPGVAPRMFPKIVPNIFVGGFV